MPKPILDFACLGATRFVYIWRKPHYEHAIKVSRLSDFGPHRNPKKTLWTIQFTSMSHLFLGAADYGYLWWEVPTERP